MRENGKKSIIKYFIPRFVSNRVVVFVFDLFRKIQRIFRFHVDDNYNRNLALDDAFKDSAFSFIENQKDYSNIFFGKTDMAYAGCEIIAAYNAMIDICKNKENDLAKYSLRNLISVFEKDGMVRFGKFGTAPKSVRDFFIREGFKVCFSTKENKFDQIANDFDTTILTFYNNRDNIFEQVHTICVTKDEYGFHAHNVYCDGTIFDTYGSITEILEKINSGMAKGIAILGISKKIEEKTIVNHNYKEDKMQEVYDFLKSAGTYYLATVDGDQPRVRPFGTIDIFEGKLYIQTGKIKDVSKQIQANPKVEISAFLDGKWIRVAGKLVRDDRIEAKKHMLDAYPSLQQMYSATDDNTEVLYFENATATISSFTEAPKTITF